MKLIILRLSFLFSLLIAIALPSGAMAISGETLVVAAEGPYTTISAALSEAEDGDTIEVRGGQHEGNLIIEKSVNLLGIDWPVIDGLNKGTVVKLIAPGTILKGFIIRNSGSSLDEENSGIAGEAPNLLIDGNQLEETLFGIYLRKAPGSKILNNNIQSKDLDLPRRGDPVRVWYSNNVLIENNQIDRGRDVVLWYSANLTVSNNTVANGRYGLHFMYCDDAIITGNSLLNNSVGTFMMYSRRLNLIENTIAYNHGPSGFGIGLKDMDDAVVKDNLFLGNRVGAHLDNSPREVDSIGTFQGNLFAYNDTGVNLMPSVRHNQFSNNTFLENQEQVNIGGGGMTKDNLWSMEGSGNYWSDYAGYDYDQNGVGDEIYQANKLFEDLVSRYPDLRLFNFSPSAQAIDFAAKAIPFVRPQPKLTDENPLMSPIFPQGIPPLPTENNPWLPWLSAGLVLIALFFIVGNNGRFTRMVPKNPSSTPGRPSAGKKKEGYPVIIINKLSKRFKKNSVLDQISFEVDAGEAVALWGPNGAGKTTSLRCLIGLLPFTGEITVNGINVKKDGKAVRKQVGFIPQELSFHDDMTVIETMRFYAKLKNVPQPRESINQQLLEKLELSSHQEKKIQELSGGMKQRLALAIAVLGDPPILILDEPTSNLDSSSRESFLNLLAEFKGTGKTLIFSSHRLEEIASLADRVLLLDKGKLVADCAPLELSDQAGWNVNLRLFTKRSDFQAAMNALSHHGYHVSPNGKGIKVKVTPGQKGRPIGVLNQAGIQVEDFDIELQNG
jgi:nitrous oxidase accessory protein